MCCKHGPRFCEGPSDVATSDALASCQGGNDLACAGSENRQNDELIGDDAGKTLGAFCRDHLGTL